MLTHSMSTLRVLRMLMHLSSGHVTLPPEKFHNPGIFLPIGLRAPGGLTLGCPTFLVIFSTRDLRDASADRREILQGGQY